MKRRVARILAITIGLVLVTGIAYAAKKKGPVKPSGRTPDPTHEEEAFRAELLDATGDHADRSPGMGGEGAKKTARATGYEEGRDRNSAKQPKK
jgi:hypothetical protein